MPAATLQPRPTAALRRWLTGPWPAVLLGAACFLNTLPNRFIRDDIYVIERNPRIHSLLNWRGIWLSNWWELAAAPGDLPPAAPDRLYRPFTLFTFAVNYALGGHQPGGYFALNALLHAATCGLVWSLGRRLIADRPAAAVAAALFAVHPIHCEAVANAVGRADILATLFLAGGLCVLLPDGRAPRLRRGLAAAGLFLLALLAKESSACYVGLAAVVLLLRGGLAPVQRRFGWAAAHAALLLLPLAVYLPLRSAVLGSVAQTGIADAMVNPLLGTAGFERLIGVFTVAGYYARAVFLPVWLSHDYGLAVIDPAAGVKLTTVLGAGAAGGLVAALAGLWRATGAWRHAGLCAVLFSVSYALISNTFLLIGTALGERLLYGPSVFLLLGVAVLARVGFDAARRRSKSAGRVLAILGGVALLLLALRTVARNADWRDGATLAAADVAAWPQSAQLQATQAWHLGNAVVLNPTRPDARQLLERAQRHAEASLRICPTNTNAERVLAEVLLQRGDAAGALAAARRILARDPDDWQTHANLTLLLAESDPAAALRHARAAYRLEPRAILTRANLAQALVDHGAVGEALELLRGLERDLPEGHALRPQVRELIRQLEAR